MSDVFYMEQPQQYLNEEYISDEFTPKSDKEKDIIEPIVFDNPKIRVGRYPRKKRYY